MNPTKKKPVVYKKPKCPKCGSTRIQTRKTDRKRWCRNCLHDGELKDFQ